ncbi:hypothetical protein [Fonticella tunisiensis]|uniref:hypothetical protein n=1 Tax=Fonticella tunisiensis TaxID=1096341 RepID=UPI0014150206|nr:hypothetical protein [Fonticella tunisiensis]
MSRRNKLIVSCYIKDEGRPLEITIQVGISNHLKVLLSKAMVLSIKEKARQKILSDECYGDERK